MNLIRNVSALMKALISFSFINIRICICPLLKVSVLLQLSTFLLPISEVLDRKYFNSYYNLQINNGGVIFMDIRSALMSKDTILYAIIDVGERKNLKR